MKNYLTGVIFICLFAGCSEKEETVTTVLQKAIDTYHKQKYVEYKELAIREDDSADTLYCYYEKSPADTIIGLRFEAIDNNAHILYNGSELFILGLRNTSFFYLPKDEYELYEIKKPFIPIRGFAFSYPAFARAFKTIKNDNDSTINKILLPDTTVNGLKCKQVQIRLQGKNIMGDSYFIFPDVKISFTYIFLIDKKQNLLREVITSNSFGSKGKFRYVDYTINRPKPNIKWHLSDYPYAKEYVRYEYKLLPVGSEIPDFDAKIVDTGKEFGKTYIKGTPVLFLFLNNNCGVARMAIPMVNNLAENNPGFRILGINNEDRDIDAIKKYIEKENIRFPVALGNSELAKSFGVDAWPTFMIINKKGIVSNTYSGYSDELESVLQEEINEVL